jgi:hypothetical protein
MFQPYLAILRQLFTFRNHHTALVLKSKYFNAIAFSSFTLKYVCLRTQFFTPFSRYFPLTASVFFVLFYLAIMNISVLLLLLSLLFLCATLVCMCPLVECKAIKLSKTNFFLDHYISNIYPQESKLEGSTKEQFIPYVIPQKYMINGIGAQHWPQKWQILK